MKTIYLLAILAILTSNLSGQTVWEKHPGNPIMTAKAESWEDPRLLPGPVIFYENEYHMWYSGGDFLANGGVFKIGHATSDDGISWTRDSLPVLDTGSLGEWDDITVWKPSVLYNEGVFHMWYSGYGDVVGKDHGDDEIGHATSTDGITWVKDVNNPVLKEGLGGQWDSPVVVAPSVIYDGTDYHMYYHASSGPSNGSIGHATSPDGTVWTRDPQNPIISKGSWDTPQTIYGGALYHNSTYHMWYTAGSFLAWDIGYATSDDGSSWKKYGEQPVMSKGSEGFDTQFISAPSIIYDSDESRYKMWYSGQSSNGTWGIGYAESNPFVSIPDAAFMNALRGIGVDKNGDGQISYTEAAAITSMNLYNKDISDMTGIAAFINLDSLSCDVNQLTELDVSKNKSLTYLSCYGNDLTSLDVTSNINMAYLNIGIASGLWDWCCDDGNLISQLDLSNNKVLTSLSCANNQLISLDVSNNAALTSLKCSKNSLSSLDLSNNDSLEWLECYENNLTGLDVTNNSALTELYCFSNKISDLDVSNNIALRVLRCGENPLARLNISNNSELGFIGLFNIPVSCEVCVWTMPFPPPDYAGVVNTYNSPDIHFITECSSTEINQLLTEEHSLYPNPAEKFINIKTELSGEYLIKITSLNGQEIYSNTLEGTNNQIDVSSFQRGVYIFTIRSKDFITTKKIIKL